MPPSPVPPRSRLRFALPRPVPPGLWRRVPPAIFPPLLGGLGLVLAWRGAAPVFALPPGLAEAGAGVMIALTAFALLAYGCKLGRRPAVLGDELGVLPGRAGVAAAALCLYLLAGVMAPYGLSLARAVLVAGLGLHVVALAVLLGVYRAGPPELRRVTPVWHLNWAGFIVAARVAPAVGWPGLAEVILWPALIAAVAIWIVSLRQFVAGVPPAPLRPMLAIHAAPAALIATVAAGQGWPALAWFMAVAAATFLAVLALAARWLLAAGPSPMWGALTFPLAATAGAWVTLAASGAPVARLIAAVMLVAATLAVPPIIFMVLRDWARGRLAVKTNAAIA